MLNDMSMFKKMKERITDEVNLATNKLQNLQIIDQLAYTIGQQSRAEQAANQNQQLPELSQVENQTHRLPTSSKFSLFDTGSKTDGTAINEQDELNTSSEISPQHQLFNENSIIRLQQTSTSPLGANNPLPENHHHHHHHHQQHHFGQLGELVESTAVINIQELISELHEEEERENDDIKSKEDCLDVEIDLLTDEPVRKSHHSYPTRNGTDDLSYCTEQMTKYKAKFIKVAEALINIYSRLETERREFQLEKQKLFEKISDLNTQLDSLRNQQESNVTTDTATREAPNHNHDKTVAKVKDLEKLLAKCKESLKSKNAQIKRLRESLSEVESFKDQIQSLKKELVELRGAHETWTVSIAENKRVMHQEIENKNSEINSCLADIANVKAQLADEKSKTRQLKSSVQDLENKLVGTSVAHQKERDSLIRELASDKNNAIKQLSKEHELNLERVKLDLEKLIEAAKLESLNKEENLLKSIEENRILQESNRESSSSLEEKERALVGLQSELKECKDRLNEEKQKSSHLEEELSKKSTLEEQIEALSKEVAIKDREESAMSTTEFEYLKNIVHQFMLGKQPLVLARVISAVFKFDQNQVEQICKMQEIIHNG